MVPLSASSAIGSLIFLITRASAADAPVQMFFPDFGGESCRGDDQLPDWVLGKRRSFVFDTAEVCCARFFPWKSECVQELSEVRHPFYPDFLRNRCRNSDEAPESLAKHRHYFFFDTAKECCGKFFSFRDDCEKKSSASDVSDEPKDIYGPPHDHKRRLRGRLDQEYNASDVESGLNAGGSATCLNLPGDYQAACHESLADVVS